MPNAMRSSGENLNHFNGVRIRVLGEGNLKMRLLSLPDRNDVQAERVMVPLDMSAMDGKREPLKKVNFPHQQRVQLEIKTTDIDEYFKVTRIAIFYKPVFTNFPG